MRFDVMKHGVVNLIRKVFNFQLKVRSISYRLVRTDFLILFALIIVSGAAYTTAVSIWGENALRLSIGGRWFQSDGWRVFDDMTDFGANHHRDRVHPLFSLFAITTTTVFRAIIPMSPVGGIRLFNGLAFVLWCSLLYATMRLIGARIIDSVVLTILAAVSAGSLFWFIVPETYVPGTVSILICFFVVALATKRDWPLVLAAAGSLSFTLTNWVAGLSAIASSRSIGRALALAGLSLGIVLAAWSIGKAIYPHPGGFFLLPNVVQGEASFIDDKDAGGLREKLAGTIVSPIVAPELKRTAEQPTGALLSFQSTAVTSFLSGNILFVVSSCLWLLTLACSIPALFWRRDRFSLALGITIACQLMLHLVYGDETFLYSLHFVPLFILILAVAMTTAARRAVLSLSFALIVLISANNVMRLDQATNEPVTGTDSRLDRLSPPASHQNGQQANNYQTHRR